jgi:hypothetical protein
MEKPSSYMENQLDGTIPPSCWPHHPMQNRQSAMRNFWFFGPKIDVNDWNVTISEVSIDVFSVYALIRNDYDLISGFNHYFVAGWCAQFFFA